MPDSEAPDLYGMTEAQLRAWAAAMELPAFRGSQVMAGLYRPTTARFADIPALPQGLAQQLDGGWTLPPASEDRRQESADGTVKSLLRLRDGRLVECVSIPAADRHTVCVSSQVGCAVGCTFCASGRNGVERDLTAGEMVWQVWHHHRRQPVTNVVFMGSGEPLFNYPQLLQAIRVLGDPKGLGLGRRRITVSTSGVPERIRDLGRDEPQITLALSLHAADDATRSRLVPINRRWPLAEVMAAIDDYAGLASRRVTFEYVCLADANLTPGHADALAKLAHRHRVHVNLIPFNAVAGSPHRAPGRDEVARFHSLLLAAGVNATVRGSRGTDIAAACGQLKRQAEASAPPQTPCPTLPSG